MLSWVLLCYVYCLLEAYAREQTLIVQEIVSKHNGSDFVFAEQPEAKKELWKVDLLSALVLVVGSAAFVFWKFFWHFFRLFYLLMEEIFFNDQISYFGSICILLSLICVNKNPLLMSILHLRIFCPRQQNWSLLLHFIPSLATYVLHMLNSFISSMLFFSFCFTNR